MRSLAAKHQKPTIPFGHMVFTKSGKVYPVLDKLGEEKEEQEHKLIKKFIGALEYFHRRKFSDLKALDQNDQDFAAKEGDVTWEIQLTEAYIDLSKHNVGIHGSVAIPLNEEVNNILKHTLKNKLLKYYPRNKNKRMMLIAYDLVGIGLTLKEKMKEDADELLSTTRNPFDEIWYFYPYAQEELGVLVELYKNEK